MPSAAAQDVLQAVLERRAAQKRREMAGVQGFGSVSTSPAAVPLELPFARQVESLDPAQIPPRNEPLPFAKNTRPDFERYLPARILAAPSRLFGGLVVDPAVEGVTDLATLAGDVYRGEQPTMSADPQTGEMHTDPGLSDRAMNAAANLGTGGLATAGGRSGVGIFGGSLAKTADIGKLTRATDMMNGGFTPEEIWKETGWFKGADDKWRFEISDEAAAFNEPIAHGGSDEVVPLGERLLHERAYEAYPDLKDIRSNIEMWEGGGGGMYGIDDTGQEALVASGRDPLSLKKTALHELQHAVQAREGFARGGNPNALIEDALAARKRWEDVEKPQAEKILDAEEDLYNEWLDNERINQGTPQGKAQVDAFRARYAQQFPENAARRNAAMDVLTKGPPLSRDLYERLAGETEARNVSTRSQWADKFRRADPPWKTQDVPTEQQIVRFRDR